MCVVCRHPSNSFADHRKYDVKLDGPMTCGYGIDAIAQRAKIMNSMRFDFNWQHSRRHARVPGWLQNSRRHFLQQGEELESIPHVLHGALPRRERWAVRSVQHGGAACRSRRGALGRLSPLSPRSRIGNDIAYIGVTLVYDDGSEPALRDERAASACLG